MRAPKPRKQKGQTLAPRVHFSPPPLPEKAAPFVRELLLEISRRIPPALGAPPDFQAHAMGDARGCIEASVALLGWLDASPSVLRNGAQELDSLFGTLFEAAQAVDAKLHRAVRQARGWVEEDLIFFHAVYDVLNDVKAAVGLRAGQSPISELLQQILSRIRTKEEVDSAQALNLSADFDRVRADLELLRSLISQVMDRAREFQDRSMRDGLTGLWNRQAFDERLNEEIARAKRYASHLSLAVCDVDHFKAVNDAHGHGVGDRVLQTLAVAVKATLRRSDFLARYGGEEFAVILPSTTLPQALAVAEKIRGAAESAARDVLPPSVPVTVSVGVGTAYDQTGNSAESLFERADRALYRAKTLGRNRVEVSTALPA